MTLQQNTNLCRCACSSIRRATRAVTQFYDKFMKNTGLTTPQFSLLVNIYKLGSISVNDLADKLLMDQTTVTRNITVLKKYSYVSIKKEESDARKKFISLTKEGLSKVTEILPLWENTQIQIEAGIGKERYQLFLDVLDDIEKLTISD